MISVIICHHMGSLILNCLESIKKSKNAEYEIIVVTSDKSIEKFENADRTVYSPYGPAYKRNVGYRFASGDSIAFFDDDTELDCDSLYHLEKVLNNEESTGMVFGKLLNMERRNRFDEAGSFLTPTGFLYARAESGLIDKGQFEEVCPVLSGKSAACMIKRKVFWKCGMFDASFEILGEETDLSWRVWLLGYQVLYIPQSITFHAFNTKFKPLNFYSLERIYFNGCKNYLIMLIKNLETRNLRFALMFQYATWILSAFGMFLTGKFKAGSYIFKALSHVSFRKESILHARKEVQKNRVKTDKELFKFIMKNPPISYYFNRFIRYIQVGLHG